RHLRLARVVDQLVNRRHRHNLIQHGDRSTAKRASGGSLSLPTEFTPFCKGTLSQGQRAILARRAAFRWHPTASREAADTREAALRGQAEYPANARCRGSRRLRQPNAARTLPPTSTGFAAISTKAMTQGSVP